MLEADYAVMEGMLFYQNKKVVPDIPHLKEEIFKIYHEIPMAGHRRIQKTYKAISETFYWKNMRNEIQDLVAFANKLNIPQRGNKAPYNPYIFLPSHGRI